MGLLYRPRAICWWVMINRGQGMFLKCVLENIIIDYSSRVWYYQHFQDHKETILAIYFMKNFKLQTVIKTVLLVRSWFCYQSTLNCPCTIPLSLYYKCIIKLWRHMYTFFETTVGAEPSARSAPLVTSWGTATKVAVILLHKIWGN